MLSRRNGIEAQRRQRSIKKYYSRMPEHRRNVHLMKSKSPCCHLFFALPSTSLLTNPFLDSSSRSRSRACTSVLEGHAVERPSILARCFGVSFHATNANQDPAARAASGPGACSDSVSVSLSVISSCLVGRRRGDQCSGCKGHTQNMCILRMGFTYKKYDGGNQSLLLCERRWLRQKHFPMLRFFLCVCVG